MPNIIPVKVEISARHLHVKQDHLETLFGQGFELERDRELSQEGEFASKQTVILKTDNAELEKVRVVGPARDHTQVEISKTDARFLGISPPIRRSGDIKDSAAAVLIGPAGKVELKEGVIIAKRHLHCPPKQARENNIEDGQVISVKIEGERSVTFHNAVVRVVDNFTLAVHLDTDEANAAGLDACGQGVLIVE